MFVVPHVDPSVVIGLAAGIIGSAGVFRTAKLNALKTDLESLARQVADLTKQCTTLEVRCETLKDNLQRAEEKVVEHYTARQLVSEENRELNKMVRERDDTIIELQRKMLDMQNNTLRKLSDS